MSFIKDLIAKATGILNSGRDSLKTETKPQTPVTWGLPVSKPTLAPVQTKTTTAQTNVPVAPIKAAPPKPQVQWGIPEDVPVMPRTATQNSTPSDTVENPVDVLDGIVKGGEAIAKFGKEMAQDTARAVGTVGITAGNTALPGQPFEREIDTTGSPLTRALFGGKPVRDLQAYGEAGRQFIKEVTGKEIDSRLNPLLGVGGVMLNLAGGNKGKFIENVAKSTDKDYIWKSLTKENPSFNALNDEEAAALSDLLAKTNDPKDVNDIINRAEAVVKEKTPTPTKDVPTYIKENIAKREAERGESTFTQKVKDGFGETGKKLVDFTLPIDDALAKGKKNDQNFAEFLTKNPSKDIHNQVDRVLRSPQLATSFIRDNGFDKIIQQVDDLDEFDEYLLARHAIDVDTRGITTGRDLKMDEQLIRELGPKYEEQAKAVTAYSQKLLDLITEGGLISKEVSDALKKRYPNYVPLQRIFSEAEEAESYGSKAVASLGKQSVVQTLKGSERAIESPIRSLIERTNKAVEQVEKNKAADLITSYNGVKDNPFQLRKVKSTDDVAADMGHISVIRNGEKEIWETTKDIANAAKMLNVEQLGIVTKVLAAPVRVARAGITGLNPSFLAANMVRDQIGSFIMADNGLRASVANPSNFIKALWGAVGHGELYDEWVRAGGGGTSFDMGRQQLSSTVDRIRAGRSLGSKALYTIKNPSQLFRALEDTIARSEELTRIQQYRAHRDAALAKGLTKEEAEAAGAAASRENSTNFARRGEWGTALNSTFLYLNAGIQGSRTLIRNMKNKPALTSAKIATSLLFPVAAVTYWNLSDPERKKVYDDIDDYEKENNFILVLDPVWDEENKRWNGVYKIPHPPGVGQFTNLVRRPIEASQGLDEVKFGEIAKALTKTVSPVDVTSVDGAFSSLTPQALKPGLQAYTNKNFFTGKPIVYPSEQRLPENEQIRKNTSGTAAKVAEMIGASPIKTDQFIKDTTGGVGSNVLNALDRIFTPDQVGGMSVTEGIKRRFVSASGGDTEQKTEAKVYEALDNQDAETASRKKKAEEIVAELNGMTNEERKAKLLEIGKTDKLLFEKVLDVKKEEAKGLSDEEKAMTRLNIQNGARAEYIYENIKDMDSAQAKAYLLDLSKKKILTDDVLKQVLTLKTGGKI